MIYTCGIDTPLGPATAASEDGTLTGFWFIGQKYYPLDTGAWQDDPTNPVFAALREWIAGYFAGNNPVPGFPLDPHGTPFQKAVWNLLMRIPYGQLTTYGELARRLAAAQGRASLSAQAVGGAVGHNPISLLIPCHRVVGAGGSLTGYAGGIDKKRALLALEHAELH